MLDDARTGMPAGMPAGAMCVQRFDDSLNSAIRITYRISLRSSSMPEPRDPLLKVLTGFAFNVDSEFPCDVRRPPREGRAGGGCQECSGAGPPAGTRVQPPTAAGGGGAGEEAGRRPLPGAARRRNEGRVRVGSERVRTLFNDPSAGSPTETLLRLLLPLNDRVWTTFRPWVVVADLPGPVRRPH